MPLADKLRPQSLEDYQGQSHLVGEGKIVRSFIENNRLNSLIFWGPPGTGKTTLSRIIVRELDLPSVEFAATISTLDEARRIMKGAAEEKKLTGKPLVLFVDEIHHFNKKAQDAFLPYVERGDIILLGTTIENPAYKINRALLSRLKILEFYPHGEEDLLQILRRGIAVIGEESGHTVGLSKDIEKIILNYSSGDARRLLNLLELIFSVHDPGAPLTEEILKDIIREKVTAYDRSGEDRYRLISAFHKSVRNSDVDGSLFWLYRMMEGGEDPLYILRRMIRICSEDIGLADPRALRVCLDAKGAFEYLGEPEGNLFLTQAVVYLAAAPKSNALYLTEKKMKKIVAKYGHLPVPLHIVNASNFVAAGQGAGKSYDYAHDFAEKTTAMETLPEEVKERDFYRPDAMGPAMGFEKTMQERIGYWQRVKARLKKTFKSK